MAHLGLHQVLQITLSNCLLNGRSKSTQRNSSPSFLAEPLTMYRSPKNSNWFMDKRWHTLDKHSRPVLSELNVQSTVVGVSKTDR